MPSAGETEESAALSRLEGLEGVASAMAATRDGIDALLRDRGLRRTPPELTAESLLRGAESSARLAGSTASGAELRDGSGDPVARSAVRLTTDLMSLVPVLRHSPQRVITRLHILATKGEVPDEDLGRPLAGADTVRLAALGRLLVSKSTAPALVVAAVAHAEVHAIAPFGTADDLVARALERLVLVAKGVDPVSLTVPEAGHAAMPERYRSALEGYVSGGRGGVHAWLLYAAEAFAAGAEASPLADRA